MDAISFVLGVQSAQLRGTVLRDLVYAFDLADREESRTAFVKLIYEAEDGSEICFSRLALRMHSTTHHTASEVVQPQPQPRRISRTG